eukprot:9503091-Pyramimonas_sp.AAC.1
MEEIRFVHSWARAWMALPIPMAPQLVHAHPSACSKNWHVCELCAIWLPIRTGPWEEAEGAAAESIGAQGVASQSISPSLEGL